MGYVIRKIVTKQVCLFVLGIKSIISADIFRSEGRISLSHDNT